MLQLFFISYLLVLNLHFNLISKTKIANVNAQNAKGVTALHMAISYDYYDCVKLLVDAGANVNLVNHAGASCFKGIDGDKSLGVCQLVSAKDGNQAKDALNRCDATISDIEKASYVQAGLKVKKAIGAEWTPEIDNKFKDILAKLP